MSLLPQAYAMLEHLAAQWALPTTAARAAVRGASTAQERQAFHAAFAPHAQTILAQLDAKPIDALDDQEKRLLDLLLTFAHVALAVEIQGDAEEQHARWRHRMVITASPADQAA